MIYPHSSPVVFRAAYHLHGEKSHVDPELPSDTFELNDQKTVWTNDVVDSAQQKTQPSPEQTVT